MLCICHTNPIFLSLFPPPANNGLTSAKPPRSRTATTGMATRFWQLGIEMRPFFYRQGLWVYPLFASVGASFGYWLEGVDQTQTKMLADRKASILEKRARRAQKEAELAGAATA